MIRPATPGTLLTLAAAVLLGLVTISTPIWNSIYFLKATIGGQGAQSGQEATLGTLGYCISAKCSTPSIGYEFDPNQLLGISIIPEKYTSAVIKGLTYTLVLHPVALGIAVLSVLLGLLAHCREMSMNCLPTCLSSIATVVTAIAFGLDLALFLIAKKRINSIDGASAELGTAVWMTLAAWILLFCSGFAFCCGRGSRSNRSRVKDEYAGGYGQRPNGPNSNAYGEQMRLEALQAEADRKQRQAAWDSRNANKNDLPKFAEYETEHEVPLTKDYDDGAYGSHPTAQHRLGYSQSGQAVAVAGVGEGYGRREPSAMTAYAPPLQSNAAGHGAHSIRSASNMGSSVPEPMPQPTAAYYMPGHGPQPYREGLENGFGPSAPYPAAEAPPPVQHSADYAYDTAGAGPRRQPTGDYGHPTEYSGATFGGPTGGHGDPNSYPAYEPQSTYPQRQPSEGGSRMKGPRTLPPIPPISPIDQPQNAEIPYGTAPDPALHGRTQGTRDANDGFGLTAATSTLTAPGARIQAHGSENGYDHYASSAYGHQNQDPATGYEDARKVPSSGYHQSESYYNEGQSSVGPPEYDSAVEHRGYEHMHSRQYGAEKH
ncbi:hypothetical protein ACQY0O_007709 [Thecaphora frezii]